MKFIQSMLFSIAVVTLSTPVFAGDVAAGKATFAAKGCIGCHGAGGIPVAPTYPQLKGRDAAFVRENLTNFRSGKRPSPIMNAMAASLKDEDIENLAAYIDSLR